MLSYEKLVATLQTALKNNIILEVSPALSTAG